MCRGVEQEKQRHDDISFHLQDDAFYRHITELLRAATRQLRLAVGLDVAQQSRPVLTKLPPASGGRQPAQATASSRCPLVRQARRQFVERARAVCSFQAE